MGQPRKAPQGGYQLSNKSRVNYILLRSQSGDNTSTASMVENSVLFTSPDMRTQVKRAWYTSRAAEKNQEAEYLPEEVLIKKIRDDLNIGQPLTNAQTGGMQRQRRKTRKSHIMRII